jgi:hypothetical protein
VIRTLTPSTGKRIHGGDAFTLTKVTGSSESRRSKAGASGVAKCCQDCERWDKDLIFLLGSSACRLRARRLITEAEDGRLWPTWAVDNLCQAA